MTNRNEPMLVLASQSPRRKELLSLLGTPFSVIPASIDETPFSGEAPEAYVVRMAREKGQNVAARVENARVLSADTIVVIDGEILGKPVDRGDAARMIGKLSGREHAVYTAVCLIDTESGEAVEKLDRTRVWFRTLDATAIAHYLDREDVMDKAGAYAIQGLAGVYITKIEGNCFNVMGLPMGIVDDLLKSRSAK